MSARFSGCRTYRYELEREWDGHLPTIVWCGLNPSTADESKDDPTIRREVDFSKRWGFGRYIKVNAYAFRATKPKDMLAALDPEGPENLHTILRLLNSAQMFVACWGNNITPRQSWKLRHEFRTCSFKTVHILGLTNQGAPKHPLYVKADTLPVAWIY